MKIRQKILFKYETFLSGILLDGRFNVILSEEEIQKATEYLQSIWMRYLKINEDADDNDGQDIRLSSDESDVDDVEALLRNFDKESSKRLARNKILQV